MNQIRACSAGGLLVLVISLGACTTMSARALLPDPAMDDPLSTVRGQRGRPRGRLFLGDAGGVPTRPWRDRRDGRLRGRFGADGDVRDGRDRHDRTRGVGGDYV